MSVKAKLTATGFQDIIRDWENLAQDLPTSIQKGVDNSLLPIASAMRSNTTMMFNKGYMTGVMVESISHTATIGSDDHVYGSVGIYDMSRKTASTKRRLPAPVLAYMYEHGIRPHSLASGVKLEQLPTEKSPRGRPAKGKQGGMMHKGSAPIPFLSSAWDANSQKITPILVAHMDKEISKL